MARTKQNGEAQVEISPEEMFENTTKAVAARARDINKSVRDWRDGGELEDLILEVQLGQRKLQKALNAMSAAYKELQGK